MNKLLIHEFGTLKLDKNGTWYHNDQPFVHEGMSKVFHENIIKENNSYFLKLGKSQVPVEIEDVAIWINDIDVSIEENKVIFYLSNSQEYTLDSETELILENETELYCYINNEKAKFTKKTFNLITRYLNEDDKGYYLQIGTLRLPINTKK